jgi:hypothetical protein
LQPFCEQAYARAFSTVKSLPSTQLQVYILPLGISILSSILFDFLDYVLHSCLGHVLFTFGNSDLSVWCFSCDAYLDAQVIMQLRPVYETAYILKFGEAPPFRTV